MKRETLRARRRGRALKKTSSKGASFKSLAPFFAGALFTIVFIIMSRDKAAQRMADFVDVEDIKQEQSTAIEKKESNKKATLFFDLFEGHIQRSSELHLVLSPDGKWKKDLQKELRSLCPGVPPCGELGLRIHQGVLLGQIQEVRRLAAMSGWSIGMRNIIDATKTTIPTKQPINQGLEQDSEASEKTNEK